MAGLRKSRRSRRTKRKSRVSRRSRQRGGATIVLNCTLDAANKVQVASPPPGVTLDTSVANTLSMTPTTVVHDINFAGPGGPVNPRGLGVGTGIMIEQGATALVPKGFTAVRALLATQKRLNSTTPANGAIKIRNLNTSNLGLTATNRSFTITVTTP